MTSPALIPRRLTVAEVAETLGVDANKVLRWIKAGELRAIDVSQKRGVKPRWRIAPADLELFETRRSNTLSIVPKQERRRKPERPPGFIEYV